MAGTITLEQKAEIIDVFGIEIWELALKSDCKTWLDFMVENNLI